MEFTLDNRLEIRLHVFACNFYDVSDAVLADPTSNLIDYPVR